MLRGFVRTPEVLIFLVSLWVALTCNAGYWRLIGEHCPPGELQTLVFLGGFFALTVGLISLVLLILTLAGASRVVLSLSLLVAAGAGYFTANLGMLFDTGMLINVMETNRAEVLELINLPSLAFVAAFGVLPAVMLWRQPLARRNWQSVLLHKGVAVLVSLALIGGPLIISQKEIFSIARNHRELRHMIAPLNIISASYASLRGSLETPAEFSHIALDATHPTNEQRDNRPSVHVLIVGETARAANFGLNGYHLNTTPELAQYSGISFVEASSCGTATAISLPCMFSIRQHTDFDRDASRNEDNLLDIAARAGYEVYWVDNGNGCKGICVRVHNRDVHASHVNSICPDDVCYDEILVEELRDIVAAATNDTMIVLHQLGSHGPAYYRRYPDEYRIFRPDCRSADFGQCSKEEISNAYDNTIAYTDHVISAAIDVLSRQSDRIDASLIYVSDHGESLGEHGIYLHGMPYRFAPDQQTHIPLLAWLSAGARSKQGLISNCGVDASKMQVSHDNLFHTELGLLDIDTSAYRTDLDLFSNCRPSATHVKVARLPVASVSVH